MNTGENNPYGSTKSPKTKGPSYELCVKSKGYHEGLRYGAANIISTQRRGDAVERNGSDIVFSRNERERKREVHMP